MFYETNYKVGVIYFLLIIQCFFSISFAQIPSSNMTSRKSKEEKYKSLYEGDHAYWSEDVKQNFIMVDNCRIRYLTAGDGPPILLIHTMRTQSDYFLNLIPVLAKHYTIYAVDLPGHGGSDIPHNVLYTEAFFRQYVRKFITSLQLKNLTIVGESFGGTLALTIAATDREEIVRKIFAINPYDYGTMGGIRRGSQTSWNVFTAIQIPFIGSIVSRSETNKILQNIFYGGLSSKKNLPDNLLNLIDSTRTHQGFPYAFKSTARNWKSWITARKLYPQIKLSTHLIYSENDWSSEKERRMNKLNIPNSEFHILKNTGHFSCLDNPEGLLKLILLED